MTNNANMSHKKTTIFIASDHAGFDLKEHLQRKLPEIAWVDLGTTSENRVDYADFADHVCEGVLKENKFGVLICGSGQGMAMRANKYQKIRAALVWDEESTVLAREHNNANVLCLGSRLLDYSVAEKLVKIFISTEFAGGRHQDRIDKLNRAPKC